MFLCGACHNMGDVYFCNLDEKLVLSRNKNIQKANDKASQWFSKMKFLKKLSFQLLFFKILQFSALCMNHFTNTLWANEK